MADSILRDKSKAFAKDIVFLCRRLRESRIEGVLINQLLKVRRLVQTFAKRSMRKERRILYQSLKLP